MQNNWYPGYWKFLYGMNDDYKGCFNTILVVNAIDFDAIE